MSASFCQSCGTRLDPGASFCPSCGKGTRASPPGSMVAATPSPGAPPSTAPAARTELPKWLDLGMLLGALGALLIAIGFFLFAASIGNNNPNGYLEGYGVLGGVGILVVAAGYLFHKMAQFRARAPH